MSMIQFGLFEYTPYFALALDIMLVYRLISYIYFRVIE